MFLKKWRAAEAALTQALAGMLALGFLAFVSTSQAYAYEDYDRQVNAERDAQCEFRLTEDNLFWWKVVGKVVGDVVAVQLDQLGNVEFEGQRANPYEGPRTVTLFAIESIDPVEFFTCDIFIPKTHSAGSGSISTLGSGPGLPPPECPVDADVCPPPPPPPSCEETNTCPPPPCDTDDCNPPPPSCEETNTCPPPPSCEETNTCPPPEGCPPGTVGANCNEPGPPDEHCDNGVGTGPDCDPPGDPPNNDDCEGAEPGSPGCDETPKGPPEGRGPPDDTGPPEDD